MNGNERTVFVIYYSLYGNIEKLAKQECKGLEKAGSNVFYNIKN